MQKKSTRLANAGNGAVAKARANLQHLLVVANELVRSSAAAIILVRGDTSQVLESTHAESVNATFRWQDDHVPYDVERTHIIRDVADIQLSRAIRAMLGSYRTGFLVRVPIIVQPSHTIALLLHSDASRQAPDRNAMAVLRAVSRSMLQDARLLASEVLNTATSPTAPETQDEIIQSVLRDDSLRLLFNAQAELVAASRGIRAAVGISPEEELAKEYLSEMPCADALLHLFQRTLETGVSSPEVEIQLTAQADGKHVSARLNPVKPLDRGALLVDMRMSPGDSQPLADGASPRDADIATGASETFLMDSLLYRRSIRDGGESSFIAVRSWQAALKNQQLAALRLVKSVGPQHLGELAGHECAAELEHLVSAGKFQYIVPIPGNQMAQDKCFATAIARAAGARLNIPMVNAFALADQPQRPTQRPGYPRPPMRLLQPVPGPAIIIDDVAASGSNLFEATVLLKQAGISSLAMAWIGGDGP